MSYPKNNHQNYHAHVYFDQATCSAARDIHQQAQADWDLPVGRFHEKLVGPHTMWSFSISFTSDEFTDLIAWLEKQRGSLSVLVHAVSGDDIKDHTDYVYWLGEAVALDLSGL